MDDASHRMRSLDEDLWVVEAPLAIAGLLHIGTRMTVIRLGDDLFLHSPVALDDALRTELARHGRVRWVIAPNKVHHFFVGEYAEAFPEARLYAAPGLPEKRTDVTFHALLSDTAPPDWAGRIDQILFRGAGILNEVVFCHRASRTLLLTDLAFNIRHADTLPTRLFFRAMGVYGRFGPSRMVRATIRDKAAARESLDAILAWDFARVTVTHGVVLQGSGRRVLREAYAWLE